MKTHKTKELEVIAKGMSDKEIDYALSREGKHFQKPNPFFAVLKKEKLSRTNK